MSDGEIALLILSQIISGILGAFIGIYIVDKFF